MRKKTDLFLSILKTSGRNYPCMVRIAVVRYVWTFTVKGRIELTDIVGQHFSNSVRLKHLTGVPN